MRIGRDNLHYTGFLRIFFIVALVLAVLTLFMTPGPAQQPTPHILSEGVQKAAVKYKVLANVEALPQEIRPRYVDVLTFADVVAGARAQARGANQQPAEEDYFIALAWSCNIPWGPPKPATVPMYARKGLNELMAGAYVTPAKREMIRQAIQPPLLKLSKQDMEQRRWELGEMLNLKR